MADSQLRVRGKTAMAHWLRETDVGTVARIATGIVDRRLAVEALRDGLRLYEERYEARCCSRRCTRTLLMLIDAWRDTPCRSVSKALSEYYKVHACSDRSPVSALAQVIDYSEGQDGTQLAGGAAHACAVRMADVLQRSQLVDAIRSRIPYPRRGPLVGSGRNCFVIDLGCRTELGWRRGPWWIALQREAQFGPRGGLRWNGYMEGPAEEVVHCIPDEELLLKVHERHRLIDKGEISPSVDFWLERDKRERARRRGSEGVYAP